MGRYQYIRFQKALGSGWQIRKGKDFVPAKVKKTMAARTDWGDMLSRKKAEKPRPWWKFWDSTGQPNTGVKSQ